MHVVVMGETSCTWTRGRARVFVAILSPYPGEISGAIEAAGDQWTTFERIEEISRGDFVVSYGHRRIIKEPHISLYGGRLINLHISFLPWNRGADPNLWSFVEDTPKGVTIHQVDKGIDTGPILAQREVQVGGTLATSTAQLRTAMAALFAETWPQIRKGALQPRPQKKGVGSYHRSADKADIWAALPLGLETPVELVAAQGRRRQGL